MRITALVLVLGLAICTLISPLTASAADNSIDRREHREQLRIRQGIRSGELTRPEAGRLEAEQARIRVNERFAKMDGNLSPREREHLQRELNHASRDIYRQKHDAQVRH